MANNPKIIITYDNEGFSNEIEYIFELIFSILGIEYKIAPFPKFNEKESPNILLISYSKDRIDRGIRPQIHIFASDFFDKNYLKKESLPQIPLGKWKGLPVIFKGRGNLNDYVESAPELIETNIDIVASSFFTITRYEEIVSEVKDEFNRFRATESLAHKEGFLSRPIVQDYINLLWEWINYFSLGFRRKEFWPEGKEFGVCLTHDIDTVQKYNFYKILKSSAALLLKKRKIVQALTDILGYFKQRLLIKRVDPYWTFGDLLRVEKQNNFKSSFYFLSSKSHTDYSITDKRMIVLIRHLEEEGIEVGLHLSFDSLDNYEIMKSEKKKLDRVVKNKLYGVRQHALGWKMPETWSIQEKLGFLYDTTLGFTDQEGFRCGICLPFKPFDVIRGKTLNIWELPLIVMDCTLFRSDYKNLTPDEGLEVIKNYIHIIKKYEGLFVLLWHNYSFDEKGYPGWSEVYKKTIEYVRSFNIYNGTGREVVNWWKARIKK